MEPHPPRSPFRSASHTPSTPNPEHSSGALSILLQRLSGYSDFSVDNLQQIPHELRQLATNIDDSITPNSSQDSFRRHHGFQITLNLFQAVTDAVISSGADGLIVLVHICNEILGLFLKALKDHHGNHRFLLRRARGEGWDALAATIQSLVTKMCDETSSGNITQQLSDLTSGLFALAIGNPKAHPLLLSSPHKSPDTESGPYENDQTTLEPSSAEIDQKHMPRAYIEDFTDAADSVDGLRTLAQGLLGGDEKVRIGQAIGILAGLYPVISPRSLALKNGMQLPVVMLALIESLVDLSNQNRIVIHKAGVLSHLIPCLTKAPKDSSESVILHSLCGALLRLGAHQLDEIVALFRQATYSDAARDLLLTAARSSKQPANIQFDLSDGGHCSIELPALPRAFPPTSGYSFTTWIRVDQFDPESHTTLFGAFDATQTCFVLVYLEKDTRQLILQTSVTSSKPSVRFKKARFKAGEWYNIALVHRPPKSGSSSLAMLYVNGRFIEELHSRYPDAPPRLVDSVDNNLPLQAPASRRRPVQAFFGTPQDLASHPSGRVSQSRWSLANAHLYDTCLTLDIIAVQNAIGVRYCGNFQDCIGAFLTYRASAELNRYNEAIYKDKSDKSEIVRMTQQHGNEILPESKLLISISALSVADMDGVVGKSSNVASILSDTTMLRYHSLTRNGNPILFNAARPAINEAVLRPYGVATITGNPVISLTQPLDDATWQVGGTLPIGIMILQNALTDDAIVTAVEILFECIQDNWRTSEAMEKGDGFGVLAITLREKLGLAGSTTYHGHLRNSGPLRPPKSREALAMRLLKIILKFVGYNFEHTEKSLLINPMAYRILLVDFDTWRTVSSDCQKLYFRQIADFIWKNNNQSFNMKRFNRNRKMHMLRI